jgi:hypothetical protein
VISKHFDEVVSTHINIQFTVTLTKYFSHVFVCTNRCFSLPQIAMFAAHLGIFMRDLMRYLLNGLDAYGIVTAFDLDIDDIVDIFQCMCTFVFFF